MDVVQMVSVKHREPTLKDAKNKFQNHLKKLVVLNETWVHAVLTTQSNISLIRNMEDAVVSGMAVVGATKIGSRVCREFTSIKVLQ
jgi:hypothetical protein